MTDRRALVLVTLVPVITWLLCWPFAGVGVNDDFGYAFVVKRLLEEGRLIYNGWCSPILGAQAFWGAAFASGLGFSHDVLRLSTLPFSVACAVLAYTLHRRMGVPEKWSLFVTLLLVICPVFTPWSASFMTDVPGLVAMLGIFHATLSLARATSFRGIAAWSFVLLLIGVVGGTIRQINFVFAAIALGMELWRRKSSLHLLVPLIALGFLIAITRMLLAWYARQPYATPDPPLSIEAMLDSPLPLFELLLTFVLLLLPLGVAWLRTESFRRRTLWQVGLICLVICALVHWGAAGGWPARLTVSLSTGNTLTESGLLWDGQDTPGTRPALLGRPARVVMAAAAYWVMVLVIITLHRKQIRVVGAIGRFARNRLSADAAAIAVFLVCGTLYIVLLSPRAVSMIIFDRYLLVLIPIASLSLLYVVRRRLAPLSPGILAWVVLCVFAVYGVAITRDHFAQLRTRDRIAAELMSEGVPRTAIANGLTFDGWTQFQATGFVNDRRIIRPPGAYQYDLMFAERTRYFWYLPWTPSITPRWVIVNMPEKPQLQSGQRLYSYRTALPPGRSYIVAWPANVPAALREPAHSDQQ